MSLVGNERGFIFLNLKPLHTAFWHSIKFSRYRMGIKFDKDPLAVQQNNYTTKIVNVYIAYDLDTWQKITLNNFTLKNCLPCATSIVKNSDKEKCVYSDYGIAFDGAGSCNEQWNGNDDARNVVAFGVNSIW